MEGLTGVDSDRIIDRLTKDFGRLSAIDHDLAAKLTGQRDVVVTTPANEEQLSALMRIAHDEKWVVAPVGAGTQLGIGNVPCHIDVAVQMTKLNKIVDYSPADMVVSVQAGTPFSELQKILGQSGQMLPIDPILNDAATIGGVVATNANGPMRVYYGTLRDLTIGLRTVYPDGRLVRAGGKVVKNVAGYDMTKLFVGSLGTLACLSEITFKLRPLPRYRSLSIVSGNAESVQAFALKVVGSNLIPSRLETFSASYTFLPNDDKRWSVAVDCDENRGSGKYQLDTLSSLANEFGLKHTSYESADVQQFWRDYRDTVVDSDFAIRVTVQPKLLVLAAEKIKNALPHTDTDPYFSLSVPAGVGRLFFRNMADTELAAQILKICRQISQEYGGFAAIETGTVPIRQQLNAFDQLSTNLSLLKGVKDTIDPLSIMNTGRFFYGFVR
jgi:glycolate oxidase FAD binding subunit